MGLARSAEKLLSRGMSHQKVAELLDLSEEELSTLLLMLEDLGD